MRITDIFSTGGEVVPAGEVSNIRCPHCGKTVDLRLFDSSHRLRTLGISIARQKRRRFSVCPACGHVTNYSPHEKGLRHT